MVIVPATEGTQWLVGGGNGATVKESADDTGFIVLQVPSQAAVALNFAYYNFCKTHSSLRMTPAQAAGVEASAWTVAELIERCGE